MKPDRLKLLLCAALPLIAAGCASTLAPIPAGHNRLAINVEETDQALPAPAMTSLAGPVDLTPMPTPVPAKDVLAKVDPPSDAQPMSALPNDGPSAVPAGLSEFTADAGASLKTALGDWLQANGWRLSWRAEGSSPGRVRDFRVTESVAIQPTSIPNLLNQLLPGRGLHAIVSNKSKAVLIENDANAIGQRGE